MMDGVQSPAGSTSSDGSDWDIFGERAHSKRFPKIPSRGEIGPEELAHWDNFQVRLRKIQRDKHALKYRHRIAGGFFGLLASPPLASALTDTGRVAMAGQGRPGSYTAVDHEFIDLVLSFDSGHWGLLANHVPFAIASGIPTSTVRALRDGKEGQLSTSDRQIIAFVRAIREGAVTDALWCAMIDRMGTERGVVEFVFLTLNLLTHVRLNQVFDEVQILPEELEDLLERLEQGEYPLPEVVHHGPSETRPVPAHP